MTGRSARIAVATVGLSLTCWLTLAGRESQPATQPDPAAFKQLASRFIGPGGNRTSAVVGVPGDLNVYYAGAASGGVFKSTDGGINWTPIFDDQPAASIGSIAIAPSDPNTVWVGTGESFIRSNVSLGNGIYKSIDAGKTWTHMGLENTGRIGRVVVHPRNPDVVLACAVGHGYGPQPERGVFRTTDGGKVWERVLFVDENTGCSDLAMDPNNSSILLAGTWQIEIHTWGKYSGGPGSGVFKSTDGGATWTRLTRGLPPSPLGKIAVAVSPSDSTRAYALIETGGRGSLWRSDDGGDSWRVVNYSRLINERPHYYSRMMVLPDDKNTVYFPSNGMHVSYDGGESTESIRWGGDNHDMWADRIVPRRMMIGNDGGVMITTNGGASWNEVVLPIAQMYHVAVDSEIPYFVYGNMQDDASVRGPSNYLGADGISSDLWVTTAGCESGFSYPDPTDSNIVWGGCYSGTIERHDRRTGHTRSVTPWPDKSLDSPAGIVKYRWNWTPAIAISPHDHNVVYFGSQYVHRTKNGGQSWEIISPDLTLNDKSRMGSSGGLTPDNLGVEYWGTLFAVAESPIESGVIWAGSNDGLVQVTRDDGKTWTNVTANIPALPKWGTISNIEPSHYDKGTAYISVDYHQVNDRDPYVYRTTDYGKTWKSISSDLPRGVLTYVHVVREDPVRKGLLYAGTESALYVSFNDGGNWVPLQSGLPHAPVHWLVVQEHFNDLVVGTNGRGFYILDDVTPLQQLTPDILSSAAHLFKLRPAYRFRKTSRSRGVPNDQSAGTNPPYGASINYHLKSAPKGRAEIAILDSEGKTVRMLTGPKEPGINRVWWDLRYAPTKEPELRTTPVSHPHVWEEKRFRGTDTRSIYHWGIGPPKLGPLVAPGTYSATLTVDGQTFSMPLVVKKDPRSAGTEADVQKSVAMWLEVYDEINATVRMINGIELMRKQIEDLPTYVNGHADEKAILDASRALDEKLLGVEDELFQRYLAASDTKTYPDDQKLYLKLVWFAGEIGDGAGDVAGNPDFAPTDQAVEVHALLKQRLATIQTAFDQVMTTSVPAFNSMLKEKNLLTLVAPAR